MLDTRRRRLGARTTYAVVAVVTAAAVALRLPFLTRPAYTDEGGMLVVARLWHTGGPYLYGDLFLARPPLLIAFFRLCDALGGIVPVRVLGLGLVVIAVLAAAWAGSMLAGRRGSVIAALVAAALLTNPMLGAREIDAETVGLPLTLVSVALVLAATRRTTPRARAVLLALGGASSVGALLCKQNLADSAAFAVVLVIAAGFADRQRRRALRDLVWLAVGAAVPLAATLVWLTISGFSVGEFVYTLYGFRVDGGQTMMTSPTTSQAERLDTLLWATVKSGMVPLVLVSLWLLRRRLLREPTALALLAMLVTATVGIAGGGAYWIHYTLGLVPVTALLAARASGELTRVSRLLAVVVAVTVFASVWNVTDTARHMSPADQSWVSGTSRWFESAQQPGDSLVVLYGQAALYEKTRLRPAYPYIWTLPMRVRDPQLTDLKALLAGGDAPTFVVASADLNTWDIDPQGALRRTLDQHYRQVATVCGAPVYAHRDVVRQWPAPPTHCRGPSWG
jgi:hypothetical protein